MRCSNGSKGSKGSKSIVRFFAVALCVLAMTGAAWAADANYPSKAITLVLGWGAGGVTDVAARVFAPLLEKNIGAPIVVLNRPGASGAIGTDYANNQPADGYTILFSAETPATFQVMETSKLSFHDFIPLFLVSHSEKFIVVAGDSPYQTMQDLVEAAQKNPGKVRFSYTGPGASGHIQGILMQNAGNLTLSMTPFGSGSESFMAVLGGQVDFTSPNIGTVKDYITTGQMRALAVFDKKRSQYLPDVPAITEALPDLEPFLPLDYPNCVLLKKGAPDEVVNKVMEAGLKALADPDWKKFLESTWYTAYDDVQGEDVLKYWDRWGSIVNWILFDAGVAKKDPAEFGIPRFTGK
jgi:tripartite-type tricarboxylate transporter receptor subunit TctC